MADAIDGEGGIKLGSTSFTAPNGELDLTSYLKNPQGATFYRDYGISCIIRINGEYYLNTFKYFAGNSPYDDLTNTVNLTDADDDIEIKYSYVKVKFASPESKDKITIHIDGSANENLVSPQTYAAYQIFHVTKDHSVVEEDVTTDDTIGQAITGEEIGFSYFIRESDEWYDVIANEMTSWFDLHQTTEQGMYIVTLKDGVPATEETAIEIAEELEQYTNDKTSIDITSDETRNDLNPGYYLIISPINSNLILATTNIDITEKAFYPFIEKTVAKEDENSAIGQDVSFISEIFIPKGSKANMV